MLKLWNVFSDIPAKLKYFLHFTQGVQAAITTLLDKHMLKLTFCDCLNTTLPRFKSI